MKNRRGYFFLIVILALAFRLYKVTNPLSDGGHERQTQVAMIARNLIKDNFNLLLPRMDIFAPDPGYVLLEFPLQSAAMGLLSLITGNLDLAGRLITLIFSLGGIFCFYAISQRIFSSALALFATALYALTPMSIYFGRAVFPEALLMFFILLSLYCMFRYEERARINYLVFSALSFALALVLKPPPAVMMLFPLMVLGFKDFRTLYSDRRRALLFLCLAFIPMLAWVLWGRAAGPKLPGWNPYNLSAITVWGIPWAWFIKEFYTFPFVSIVSVGLLPVPAMLAILGLWGIAGERRAKFIFTWVVSMFVYFVLTPKGQSDHWNYHIPLLAPGCILAGLGLKQFLISPRYTKPRLFLSRPFPKYSLSALIIISHGFIYYRVAHKAYDTLARSPKLYEVASLVKSKTLPEHGFFIVVQPGVVPATSISYFMDRKVRQVLVIPPDEFKLAEFKSWEEKGAVGLVAINTPYGRGMDVMENSSDLRNYLEKRYMLIARQVDYEIYFRP